MWGIGGIVMIGDKLIEDICSNLGELAKRMEEDVEQAKKYVQLVTDLENQLTELRSASHNLMKQIPEYEKDLKEVQETRKEMSLFDSFDPKNSDSESSSMLYIKAQSIISHNENADTTGSVTCLNQNIELMLINIKSLLKNIGKDESFKELLQSSSTPKHLDSYEESKEKLSTLSYKESIENIVLKIEDKLVPVSSIDLDLGDVNNSAKELAAAEKFCETCKTFTVFAVILECYCVICVDCLEKYVRERNEYLLDNVFEASKEGLDGMCPCPKHGVTIDIFVLEKIFGYNVIEEASINALKRQNTFSLDRTKLCFFVCPSCKALIKSTDKSIEITDSDSKVRVCLDCSK
eukprot:TRINITY_DN8434_c0_g4_i1.p1 TRINITY_DN8434_c0_g4~~TRINITY_DN8434_c0_g4_i1.p1  ORF type:complete len:349 (+),score=84.75 TRINITY_DN8434_c0_g4_i1:98-1144(+)